jgi:hypothetical protein
MLVLFKTVKKKELLGSSSSFNAHNSVLSLGLAACKKASRNIHSEGTSLERGKRTFFLENVRRVRDGAHWGPTWTSKKRERAAQRGPHKKFLQFSLLSTLEQKESVSASFLMLQPVLNPSPTRKPYL